MVPPEGRISRSSPVTRRVLPEAETLANRLRPWAMTTSPPSSAARLGEVVLGGVCGELELSRRLSDNGVAAGDRPQQNGSTVSRLENQRVTGEVAARARRFKRQNSGHRIHVENGGVAEGWQGRDRRRCSGGVGECERAVVERVPARGVDELDEDGSRTAEPSCWSSTSLCPPRAVIWVVGSNPTSSATESAMRPPPPPPPHMTVCGRCRRWRETAPEPSRRAATRRTVPPAPPPPPCVYP